MKYAWILAILLTGTIAGFSQEKYSLEKCIQVALENNLLVKQAKISQEDLQIQRRQLTHQRIPSLNANTNAGMNLGRFVNPATNDFETENSFYQSAGLQAGVMLFNGFRLNHSIQQNTFLSQAALEDLRQTQNDLALNVALSYLNVLFAYENLAIAENRVKLSQDQLTNMENLISAGSRPENARYDIVAQIARDEQSAIVAQNNIDINLLSLKQFMMMDANYPLEIERPDLEVENLEAVENQSFESVYNASLQNQPQIKAASLREQASETGVKMAKSQLFPSLSFGGNVGTNWSDLAKTTSGFVLTRVPQPGVFINGQQSIFEVETLIPTSITTTPYGNQLENNLGYGLGATLSIPLYNQYSARGGIERAKLQVQQSRINSIQIDQTLKTNIQTALTSGRSARRSYVAAEASAIAARRAFGDAEKRSEIGTLTNIEYLTSRNQMDTAENNLLIAKYDYFFRVKVIEFYMGRVISLN